MNKTLIALALGIAFLAAPMFAQAEESKLAPVYMVTVTGITIICGSTILALR